MAIELPPLPYTQDALEPHVSANTLGFHHGTHHQTYVTTLNNLIAGTEHAGKSLEEIVQAAAAAGGPLFNNAAQVWNHTFFWNSMSPNGGGAPGADLGAKIDAAFGSLEQFKADFKQAAITQFGSGWAWLVADGDALKITKTPNAENPMIHGQTALFTVDVWEHAYYLDYQNRRPDFVQTVLDHLVNWDFDARNLRNAG